MKFLLQQQQGQVRATTRPPDSRNWAHLQGVSRKESSLNSHWLQIKEGRLMQKGKFWGWEVRPQRRLVDWLFDDGQTLVTCKVDAVVLGTFQMVVEITSSRNIEFLVSYDPGLLTDDISLSLSLIRWPLCHLIQDISAFLPHHLLLSSVTLF